MCNHAVNPVYLDKDSVSVHTQTVKLALLREVRGVTVYQFTDCEVGFVPSIVHYNVLSPVDFRTLWSHV